MYNLPAAALAAALPLMRQRFARWQPLAEPDRGLRDMQRWRPLLQSDSARDAIFQVPVRTRDGDRRDSPLCTASHATLNVQAMHHPTQFPHSILGEPGDVA